MSRFLLDSVGIVPADAPLTFGRYCEEVGRGVPPQLDYLVRNAQCRCGFDDIMPGTKSVVCCAVCLPVLTASPLHCARFCAIGDYHAVLRDRIGALDAWLRGRYPIGRSRICVDTVPLLERELAARAGIGAIGFNRMVAHRAFGSFIALGELLVDVDLTPYRDDIEFCVDHSVPARAAVTPGATGCCAPGMRRCVESCPTRALSAQGYDPGRCLAYWTTQHKGVIPQPYASLMGDVIWGCDRCQDACPRNAHAPAEENPSNPLNALTLHEILTLSSRKLRQRLAGTCIADANPNMLVRNALIAIRNARREAEFCEELREIAQNHPCNWVRGQLEI